MVKLDRPLYRTHKFIGFDDLLSKVCRNGEEKRTAREFLLRNDIQKSKEAAASLKGRVKMEKENNG